MKYFNYVRAYRKRNALTEDELGFLIGRRSKTSVSQIETGMRVPTLECALALQVVFGPLLRDLFPDLYEHVEDAAMRRAHVLYEKLKDRTDVRSKTKLALLEEMAARKEHSRSNA
ncbi:MAG TPA: hypothetical protein VL358_06505 [Caulobacteraceae bacterium]|jgi:DNA-binding XRE family transcriptional regulator|nr:hypothetical protein [Caulobacteraceae bacterium]